MDLVRLYFQVRSGWRVVAAALAVCFILAVLYLLIAPKIYSSRAVVQVQQQGENLVDASENADSAISPEVLSTVEHNLTSQSLLLRVIHAEKLGSDLPPKKDGTPYLDSELLETLQSKLSVQLRRGTRLIDIVVEDKSPQRAQRLASAVVTQYLVQTFQHQLDSMKGGGQYLSDEVGMYWADLPRIRDALAANNTNALLGISSVAEEPEVAGLQARVDAEEANFASTKEVFMENHPRYIAAQRRLQELQQAQQAALLRAAQRVEHSYDNANKVAEDLMDNIRRQEKSIAEGDGSAISADVLDRYLQTDRALYDAILGRMKQTAKADDFDSNPVRLVEQPLVSTKPVRPRRLLVLVTGILAGVVAGVGILIARSLLTANFTSVGEIESVLGLPIFTTVPKSLTIAQGKEAVTSQPNSFEAEAFRTLSTSIRLLEEKVKKPKNFRGKAMISKSVLFTSSNPGEGKTSCTLNYGAMLGRQGLRTLLVDADVRRAKLTTLVQARTGPGLSELLSGKTVLSEAIQSTTFENVFVLAAGDGNAESSRHPLPEKINAFLQEASTQFDRIVVDTPPINAVSDCLLMVPFVPVICFVIHAGATPKTAVERAYGLLRQANRGTIGVVLNKVSTDSLSTYEWHGYAKDFAYTYDERR